MKLKVGDKVILLDNVIEERAKLGFSTIKENNVILKSSINKTFIIKYCWDKFCMLEEFQHFNISYESIILLTEYRKLKLEKLNKYKL